MIRNIRIQGYKSFKGLDLKLRPLSVIFGPNASGKSNLLDAIYLLSQVVSRKNLKEAFEGHRGLPLESFYYADCGYDELLKRRSLRLRIEVDVEVSEWVRNRVKDIVAQKRKGIQPVIAERGLVRERFLRYVVELEALPETRYIRVVDEKLAATKESGEEKRRNAFIEKMTGPDGIERFHLRMEGQAHPRFYDVGLEHTVVSTGPYEPYYPHVAALQMELENWRVYYLEPRSIMREEVPMAEVRTIGSRGENLAAFLNVLEKGRLDKSELRNFNLALSQVMPTHAHIEVYQTKEGRVALRLFENGIYYSARLMSEGTLRLVGLLAALHPQNEATVVAFEEPENGVHPVRLKLISDILRQAAHSGKQIIATTHSSVFPEYFENDNLFVSQREAEGSTIKPFSPWGDLARHPEIGRALEDRILRGDFGG